jgi:hypothetical protein
MVIVFTNHLDMVRRVVGSMVDDVAYLVTDKGWEVYWRAKIAEEVRQSHMPICVCEPCGTIATGVMVERIIETIKGEA